MNRTPRALLKGASSILSEGASLTSNGALFDSREAKDAFKGFVKEDDALKLTAKQNEPNGSSATVTKGEDIIKESASTSLGESKEKKTALQIGKNRKRASQQAGRSAFEIYLLVLNLFLFLGILCTLIGVALASYVSQNPGSKVSLISLLKMTTDMVLKYVDSLIMRSVDFFENFDFLVYATYFSLAMNKFLSDCIAYVSQLPTLFTEHSIRIPEYTSNLSNIFLEYITKFSEYIAVLYDETSSNLKSLFPN